MVRVSLAGKVDAEHGAWRDNLLGRISGGTPIWALHATPQAMDRHDETAGVLPWPERPCLYRKEVLYIGPYRQVVAPGELSSKYSGYFHGVEAYGSHGVMDSGMFYVMRECKKAIRKADLVFCVLNTHDCYGTLVEIGLAKAWGIHVHVVLCGDDDTVPYDELVYVIESCEPHVTCANDAASIQRAFSDALAIVMANDAYTA